MSYAACPFPTFTPTRAETEHLKQLDREAAERARERALLAELERIELEDEERQKLARYARRRGHPREEVLV